MNGGAGVSKVPTVTRPEQKADERDFVREMVSMLALDLAREPFHHDPPSPDVELRFLDGRTIALEVIEAHNQSLRAAWNGARGRLENQIAEELRVRSVSAFVACKVDADAAVMLESRPRVLRETARRIAEMGRAFLAGEERYVSKAVAQKRGIEHVTVLSIAAASTPSASLAIRGNPLGPEIVQAAITSKASKLTTYREFAAHEYWLLVVGGLPVSGFVPIDDVISQRYVSVFHKTVFLERGSRCISLETEPSDT
jgi:hypothetical protein